MRRAHHKFKRWPPRSRGGGQYTLSWVQAKAPVKTEDDTLAEVEDYPCPEILNEVAAEALVYTHAQMFPEE